MPKKFSVVITQHLPLALQQQHRDMLGIVKTFHTRGKKTKWRIIGSDYCLIIHGIGIFLNKIDC